MIWRPSLSFGNALSIAKHSTYGGRVDSSYWFRKPNNLEYAEVLKITISCNFNFNAFPFDSHVCHFNLQDTKYTVNEVELLSPAFFYYSHFADIDAKKAIQVDTQTIPYYIKIHVNTSDTFLHKGETFTRCGITLKLQRKSIDLLLESFYMPSSFFAVLSMISFLIHPDKVTTRTSFSSSILKKNVWHQNLFLRLQSCKLLPCFSTIPRGLMARIPGFHPGGPGSIPGVGENFFIFC